MIAAALQQVMAGDPSRTVGLTGHPFLSMYVTNLGDRAGLLIDVELPEGAAIEDGRGFDIVEIRGGARKRVLVRPTRSGTTSPAFLGLVEFVFRETAAAGSRAGAESILLESVHEFRQFFARRAERLSESAVRGLFAELELMVELRQIGIAPLDVLQAWSGPYRGADFSFADGAGIEVKSTRVPARKVQISSEHQMEATPAGLHLFVRPLSTVSPDDRVGSAFLDVVATARDMFAGSAATKPLWDGAMEALGFDEADDYYRRWRFSASDWQAYVVREGFPRIVNSELPSGIHTVSYSLELSSIEDFHEDYRPVLEEAAAAYE